MARDQIQGRLDQAKIDLRHVNSAAEGAQNPSDRDFARSVAASHQRRINALIGELRNARRTATPA